MSDFGRIAVFAAAVAALLLATATPAAADDVCDSFGRFGPAEMQDARDALSKAVPVNDVAAARNIRFVIEPSDEPGPAVQPEGRNALIVIPEGFRRRNCRLAMISLAYAPDAIENEALRAAFSQCWEARVEEIACLEMTAALKWPEVLALLGKKETGGFSNFLAETAFNGLIFHEFAHYALGHLRSRRDDAATLQQFEFDADIYAIMVGSTAYGGMNYARNFEFLGRIEHLFPKNDSPHRSFSCRYYMAAYLSFHIGYPAQDIVTVPNVPTSIDPQLHARVGALAKGERPQGAELPFPPDCTPPPAADVAAIEADIRQLAVAEAALPYPFDENDVIAGRRAITAMMRVQPKTMLGHRLKFKAITGFSRRFPFMRSEAETAWLVREIRLEANRHLFISEDYGAILGMQAQARSAALRTTRPNAAALRDLHAQYEKALYYFPQWVVGYSADGDVYWFENRCQEALDRYRTALRLGWDAPAEMVARLRSRIAELEADIGTPRCPRAR